MSFSQWQLRTVCHLLERDGVIAYPTEAVYGLGCEPMSWNAVERLLALKRRPVRKGLILVAAAREQLDSYVDWNRLNESCRNTVLSSWPGPITWVLPTQRHVPLWLRGDHDSIAVRVSAHPPVQQLCAVYGGALVSTSANCAGKAPARTALAVHRLFGDGVDAVLHGPLGHLERPTEIRDGMTGEILRPS